MSELPRKWVIMDERGRCTIPAFLIKAIGVEAQEGGTPILFEAHPDLENTKFLSVKKGRT